MTRKSKYPKKVKTMGDRIRKRRIDIGLLSQDLAKSVGVTESFISKIENNKATPSYYVAILISKCLHDNMALYESWHMKTAFEKSKKRNKGRQLRVVSRIEAKYGVKVVR